jgi:hypothetical protein
MFITGEKIRTHGYVAASSDIQCAILSTRKGDCNRAQASKMCNVPRQTIQRYLKGRNPEIGIEAENEFEKCFVLLQECSSGLTRHELWVVACSFMENLGVTDSVGDR